jgi:hypothetical protein
VRCIVRCGIDASFVVGGVAMPIVLVGDVPALRVAAWGVQARGVRTHGIRAGNLAISIDPGRVPSRTRCVDRAVR